MDQMTKKRFSIHNALHLIDDMDMMTWTIYIKKGRRGPASIEYCVDTATQGLEEYTKKSKEWLITAVINTNDNIKRNMKKQKKLKTDIPILLGANDFLDPYTPLFLFNNYITVLA